MPNIRRSYGEAQVGPVTEDPDEKSPRVETVVPSTVGVRVVGPKSVTIRQDRVLAEPADVRRPHENVEANGLEPDRKVFP